ncbi:MAG: cell division protein FtsZ [Candidatus Hydrogenedentes bacterium]|nr:cell division protein FtsZ [Candidatus Hydrogenedentota bacterium]
MSDEFTSFEQQAVIKVCGVGGGGGNAVGRMIEAKLQDIEFITINTDAQALKHSAAGTRLQIGEGGLGAGARPDTGKQAALNDRERIAEVLRGADMIFLTAGLGGGTGTGATPIVAEVAKETGALTVAIVTLPFSFEGQERMNNALNGLAALQEHVDALIVVPNDRLALICQENTSFLNAFRLADEVLYNGVRAISELITVPGLINLDFADVRTIMESSGRALMGIGTAEGEDRASRSAQEAIVCPLLEKSSIDGAVGVIVNVKGGCDITMREVLDAVTTVKKAAHPSANIIFGAVLEEQERAELQVTVIAAGFAKEAIQPSTLEEREAAQAAAVASPPTPAPAPRLAAAKPAQPQRPDEPVPQEPQGQYLFFDDEKPRDAAKPAPEQAPAPPQQDDEDIDIPAFMRRRREQR